MNELVSIVLPTRNRRALLELALKSCLAQTYPYLEVIVVDDASTDGTEDYVRGINDPRIIYVRKTFHEGSVACLNQGFAMARGAYLTWTSDDDIYVHDAIFRMAAALEAEGDVDFVYTHYWMMDDQGALLHPARVEDPDMLEKDNYVGHCFLYRRKVYEAVGDYHPEPFLAEEYEYWLRVRERFHMKRIPVALYFHRIHPSSKTVSHSLEKMQDAVAQARQRFIPAWKHHFLVAERYYHAQHRRQALRHVGCSLVLNVVHKASWRLLALLALPGCIIRLIRHR